MHTHPSDRELDLVKHALDTFTYFFQRDHRKAPRGCELIDYMAEDLLRSATKNGTTIEQEMTEAFRDDDEETRRIRAWIWHSVIARYLERHSLSTRH
jgi:hypothetical protein